MLADLLTIYEKFGRVAGLKMAYIGDGNNMTHSLMIGGAKLGMSVVCASPAGFTPSPAIVASGQRSFVAAGRCGLPQSVRAISGNLTVVTPSAAGALKVIPGDRTVGPPSALSYAAGRTRANNFAIRLSGDSVSTKWGAFTIFNEGPGPAHVVVDVSGYFE